MEVWKYGSMEVWKNGSMEEWKNGRMDVWKYASRPAQTVPTHLRRSEDQQNL